MPPMPENRAPKKPEVPSVTTSEPARFLCEAEEPFHSGTLHPLGGAFEAAGEKINCPPDSDEHRDSEGLIVHGHPFLRLGTAERDEEQIGFGGSNPPQDFRM